MVFQPKLTKATKTKRHFPATEDREAALMCDDNFFQNLTDLLFAIYVKALSVTLCYTEFLIILTCKNTNCENVKFSIF